MIQVANIEITDVTVTPSTVVAGAQYIIAATVEPRIFGIMDADGQMITDAAGNVITTQMPITPVYGISTADGDLISTAAEEYILAEGD